MKAVGLWFQDRWSRMLPALIMLLSLPGGLAAGDWLKSNGLLWWAALASLLAGVFLARVTRRLAVATILSMITGVLFITQIQGLVLPPLLLGLRELLLLGQWVAFELSKTIGVMFEPLQLVAIPSVPPELPEWKAATERLSLYFFNLQADWPPALVPHRWNQGQILLGSILGLSVWIVSSLSTWMLARQRSMWWALLPVVGMLALNSYYTAAGWAHLVVSLSAGLLLAGNIAQDQLERRWGSDALPYGMRNERWATTGTIMAVVSVAMLLTVQVTDPEFRRQVHDTFFPPESASASGSRSRPGMEQTSPGVWPLEHLLGSGPENSKQPVMSVRMPGVSQIHFYWQASSYAIYTGHGWKQSASTLSDADAQPIWPDSAEPPLHFALLRQSFRMEFSAEQVYAAGRPVRLNQPAEGVWSDPQHMDLIEVKILTPQSAYEVLSWVPVATPDDLRTAPDDYPDWIEKTYLSIPEELPERVTVLAGEIAADAPTAYDKALALQDHLRTYPYTLDLDAPPADRDVVDYFLFDLKRGYCDYYASSMVVMARSVGLPARLAVGYVTGAYDPDNQLYSVTMAEAHSWPEIYFPEFGWIPFEPTGSRPVIEYGTINEWAEETEITRQEDIEAFEEEGTLGKGLLANVLWLLALIPVGIVLVIGGIATASNIRARRQRRGTPEQAITFLYQQLLASGRRLGLTLSPTQTPHEFLAALRAELAIRAQNAPRRMGNWETRQEEAGHTAAALVSLYADMCYGPRQPEQSAAREMFDVWFRLDRILWMFWLAGRGKTEG